MAARHAYRSPMTVVGWAQRMRSYPSYATQRARSALLQTSKLCLPWVFRGEALPSIASVSAFSLSTSTGEGAGTKVSVDGGEETQVSSASHPRGTTVVVERLFYNVPARRAFLKGARTERAAIVEIVSHLAVSHPLVGFRLSEAGGASGGGASGGGAGRDLLSLPPAGDLRERLAQVHGVGKARAFRKVEHEVGPFRIDGYAALPSLTYSSRSSCQTVSVNGRWVRAEILARALDDAYRATVSAGRYPPVALDVAVDPRKVDVNVHPTKQLVRFSDERGREKGGGGCGQNGHRVGRATPLQTALRGRILFPRFLQAGNRATPSRLSNLVWPGIQSQDGCDTERTRRGETLRAARTPPQPPGARKCRPAARLPPTYTRVFKKPTGGWWCRTTAGKSSGWTRTSRSRVVRVECRSRASGTRRSAISRRAPGGRTGRDWVHTG